MIMKNENKVAIYFDLDGTLITYGRDFNEIFETALGFEVDEEVHQYWTEQILENIENIAEEPVYKATKSTNEIFDLGIDARKVTEKYIEEEVSSTEVNSELVEVLKQLSDKHNIGILTNGVGKVQMKKIEEHSLQEHVDEIIVSNPEGVRKPDMEIFKLAKERLPAENFIYIGDTYEEDIKPARKAGFKTIYVNGEKESDLTAENPEKLGKILKNLL